MIAELYNIFNDYDKIIKYDIKLYNFIIIIKKSEFFNKFYIRFSVIIVLLSYNKIYKIFNLKRFIIIKLRFKIVDFILLSYRYFIKYLRKID